MLLRPPNHSVSDHRQKWREPDRGDGIAVATAAHLAGTCSDLGPGVHQVGDGTVTCG